MMADDRIRMDYYALAAEQARQAFPCPTCGGHKRVCLNCYVRGHWGARIALTPNRTTHNAGHWVNGSEVTEAVPCPDCQQHDTYHARLRQMTIGERIGLEAIYEGEG